MSRGTKLKLGFEVKISDLENQYVHIKVADFGFARSWKAVPDIPIKPLLFVENLPTYTLN